jgi:hypothetical protein
MMMEMLLLVRVSISSVSGVEEVVEIADVVEEVMEVVDVVEEGVEMEMEMASVKVIFGLWKWHLCPSSFTLFRHSIPFLSLLCIVAVSFF